MDGIFGKSRQEIESLVYTINEDVCMDIGTVKCNDVAVSQCPVAIL